ncbi:MAG: ATP-binding protein [Phycisphaerae bacterium]|nr:ATP-binding protein [Tepidisphaeraceae bacterium]
MGSIGKTSVWGGGLSATDEEDDARAAPRLGQSLRCVRQAWRLGSGLLVGAAITALASRNDHSATVEIVPLLGLIVATFAGGVGAGALTAATFVIGTSVTVPDFWQPFPSSRRCVTWSAAGVVAGLMGWVNWRRRIVTEQLIRIKSGLEDKVQRRTSDLASAVTRLRREMESRKRAEEELRNVASQTRCILWQAVVEGPATGAAGAGAAADAGRCLLWTVRVQDEQAAQHVLPLDLSSTTTYFKAWVKSRHPDDALAVGRTCTRAVFAGQSGYAHEYRCVDRHGQVRWLSEDVRVHKAGANRWHLFGVTTDITERKASEHALHQSEQRFALFMEHLPGLAFIKDGQGRYVYMNRACEEWFGLTGGQWQLKRDDEIDRPEVVRRLAAAEFGASGSVLEGAAPGARHSLVVLRRADLERSFVLTRFVIHRAGDRVESDLVGGLAIDVTDRLRAEDKLIAYQGKLRALAANVTSTEERERRKIAATLHDQIGSTLAVAQIRLDMLNTQPDGADFISATRRTIADVVGDLSRAIAQTRSLTCEISPPLLYEAGLGAALRWLADQVQRRHGLAVCVVDADGAARLADLGHEKLIALYQGARELLTNVVKHARATRATVTLSGDDPWASVSVTDDGVGIGVGQSRATNSFGLFNLRERFNHMGGRVVFESGPEGGTRITLVFATAVGDDQVDLTTAAAESPPPARHSSA